MAACGDMLSAVFFQMFGVISLDCCDVWVCRRSIILCILIHANASEGTGHSYCSVAAMPVGRRIIE